MRYFAIITSILMIASFIAREAYAAKQDEANSPVVFTQEWMEKLRGFHSLDDVQRAAGVKGWMTGKTECDDGTSRADYFFRGLPDTSHKATYMYATVCGNGIITVQIPTGEGQAINIENDRH